MNESPPGSITPPPLPPPEPKAPIAGKWLFWIICAAVMPGLSFLCISGGPSSEPLGTIIMLFALLGQLIGSIVLGIALANRMGRGGGMAVLLVFVLLISSVAVGTVSAFVSCSVASPKWNFH